MKNKLFCFLLCVLIALSLFPTAVGADTGPKPSIRITFENMGDVLCYGTLLSQTPSTGPYTVWNGEESDRRTEGIDLNIWQAFAEYQDSDGYYFLQPVWQINETKTLAWTYYPPQSFKILLYYPDTNLFAVSGIYERYAFDSYFTVRMDGIPSSPSADNAGEESGRIVLEAQKSYRYTDELLALAARMLITILLEMLIALFFGFREKRQLWFLVGINAATQLLINVLLGVTYYPPRHFLYWLTYAALELAVFLIEAFLCCTVMRKISKHPPKNHVCVLYALVANGVSFAAGLFAAKIFPEIF